MNYINKAVKNFANRLSNEFGCDVKIVKEEKDPVVYLSLKLGIENREICMAIHHFTKKYQNTLFSRNGKFYYTHWYSLSDECKEYVKQARRDKIPVMSVVGSIYEGYWNCDGFTYTVFGYREFVEKELYDIIKGHIEEWIKEYSN